MTDLAAPLEQVELLGYEMASEGLCSKDCRHGSWCLSENQVCRCVPGSGWGGAECASDADECIASSRGDPGAACALSPVMAAGCGTPQRGL